MRITSFAELWNLFEQRNLYYFIVTVSLEKKYKKGQVKLAAL